MDGLYESDVAPRFDALVVGDAEGEDLTAALRLGGARVIGRTGWADAVARLEATAARPLILLDARGVSDALLAGTLYQIDGIAAERGLAVILGISETQIDVAAAGLVRSDHDIVCEPAIADWAGALSLAYVSREWSLRDGVSESEAARLARLNAEVARIADVLARLSRRESTGGETMVGDVARAFGAPPPDDGGTRAADIRQIIRARRLRDRCFGAGLFEDPGWDMMLDLYAAHLEQAQVSVSSLCIAAAVAPTTALRWIGKMTAIGLLARQPDPFDRRRAFMSLSERGLEGMRRYVGMAQALGVPLV